MPSRLGRTGTVGAVGVDMVLFTVMMLARRPSPLGRRISDDDGEGERLSEFHSWRPGRLAEEAFDTRFGRTAKMLVMAVTRFRIVFELGSALKTLSVSACVWGFVPRLSSAGTGTSELLAPEGRRERRRPKKDIQ